MRSANSAAEATLLPFTQEERALWMRWRVDSDSGARDDLIQRHLPFARVIAAKLYRNRFSDEFEFSDFLQFAVIGLLEAIEGFDVERDASFRTYASHRIRGAVLDGLTTMSERQQQIEARRRMMSERAQSLRDGTTSRREPVQELAELAIGLALGYMLEGSAMYCAGDGSVIDTGYERLELRQLHDRLIVLIDGLPDNERLVIRSHYLNQVPFESVARSLQVSKARISQLHRQALNRLEKLVLERPQEFAC